MPSCNGTFTVHFTAKDPHLRARPISVLYSANKDGPWTELLTNQENTGSCRCPTRGLPFEFYVRVEAVDEAGNKGFAQWKDTVKVDLKTPVIKELTVVGVEGAIVGKALYAGAFTLPEALRATEEAAAA